MSSTFTKFDPNAIFSHLEETAEECAMAEGLADQLSEHKKILLAKITLEEMALNKSRVEAETTAVASQEYQIHVNGMLAASQKANRSRMKYKNALVWAESMRTQESSARSLISRA
jgi:hypothetical protein